jgi:hypothetical protein
MAYSILSLALMLCLATTHVLFCAVMLIIQLLLPLATLALQEQLVQVLAQLLVLLMHLLLLLLVTRTTALAAQVALPLLLRLLLLLLLQVALLLAVVAVYHHQCSTIACHLPPLCLFSSLQPTVMSFMLHYYCKHIPACLAQLFASLESAQF